MAEDSIDRNLWFRTLDLSTSGRKWFMKELTSAQLASEVAEGLRSLPAVPPEAGGEVEKAEAERFALAREFDALAARKEESQSAADDLQLLVVTLESWGEDYIFKTPNGDKLNCFCYIFPYGT